MKLVKVFGGLGNQMFQYALYARLSNEHNNVFLDTEWFTSRKANREFELSNIFNLETRSEVYSYTFLQRATVLIYRILSKTFNGYSSFLTETKFFDVDTRVFDKNTKVLCGYWQCPKYFYDIFPHLIEKFSFPNVTDKNNTRILEKIKNSTKPCISIHVRRGDYVDHPDLNGICTIEYYLAAAQYFCELYKKRGGCSFLLFSDDPDWVREEMLPKINEEAIVVDWNTGSNSFIDMQLMTICRHNIISNSTFSWWGAALKKSKHSIAVFPNTSAHSRNTEALYNLPNSKIVKIDSKGQEV